MKKLLLLIIVFISVSIVKAETVTIDGLNYDLDSSTQTASVANGNVVSGAITIPETLSYQGTTYSVTSIGNGAFYLCSDLTSVEIPNSVNSIGDLAFYVCWRLTSIEIPNSVISIGEWAFYECNSSTSLVLGNSVTEIGTAAFEGCRGLKSVEIPNSVTSLGNGVFSGCTGLKCFIVNTNNPTFSAVEGILYSKNKEILIAYPAGLNGGFEIPNSVTSIGDGAFSGCTGLTNIVIPNSVSSIGRGAFGDCTGLTSIEIPNSVTSIGDSAFSVCTGLTSIEIPNSVTSIGDGAFNGCYGLTSLVIGNSVSTIGDHAFEGCTGLKSIVIPNSVTSIGDYAFKGCYALTSIEIPNSVTSIGNHAFEGCTGLKSFVIPNSITSISDYAFKGCTGLTSIEIPNSITSIGDYAFEGCTGLKSFVIPNSITSISNGVFEGCTGLSGIEIPNSVTSIGDLAFSDCYALKSIEIPNSVTSIGIGAFWFCEGLTSIEIPNSVTKIGGGAFSECTGLKSIVIPNSVTSIEYRTFEECKSLISIEIPISVTSIGENAFYGCTGLSSIEIPNSVTSIGYSAFEGCSALKSVEIPNSVTSIGGAAFNNIEFECFTIEDGIEPIEWTSEKWVGENQVKTKNLYFGRTSNGPLSFTGVESLEISGFVESISSSCFINNPIISLVINPGNGIVIKDGAFSGCSSLTDVILPEDIAEIGANAFSGTAIKDITVPNGTIGELAFASCNLENITIGAGVESIGEKAFYGSNAISNVYATPTTPPTAENNTFSYYEAPLYVPFEAIDAYSNSNCWNLFNCQSLVMPETLTVSGPEDINGEPGETFQLSATIIPSNVTLDRVLWTSTNPAIATVDNNGLVTIQNFVAGGNIRARANTMEGGCEIIASTLYDNSPVAVVRIGSFSTSIDYINSDDIAEGSNGGIAQNDIFTLQGVCLKRNASQSDIDSLVRGIYIIGGKKVVVK